jgi:hypothetical protein
MVKVFLPSAAADSNPGSKIVAPTAAVPTRNSRRETVSRDLRVTLSFSAVASSLSAIFIVGASLFLDWLLHSPYYNGECSTAG